MRKNTATLMDCFLLADPKLEMSVAREASTKVSKFIMTMMQDH